MVSSSTTSLERNVALFPWYAVLFNAYFWMPVFFLFFSAHVSVSQVLQLEAIYYATVVVLEVPSGYLSDRFGRRRMLLLASSFALAAHLLFFSGGSFSEFAIAQMFLAGGIAFNSGTDTSFHFDSLAALGREGEYETREATFAFASLMSTGLAALFGGLAASYSLKYAYGLSALAAFGCLALVVTFTEPDAVEAGGGEPFSSQLRSCLAYLKQSDLAWLFGFAVAAIVINHIPYELYQPYFKLIDFGLGLGRETPAVAGTHMASAALVGAWFARWSDLFADRVGTRWALLIVLAVQVAIVISMTIAFHLVVVLILVFRGVPGGLIRAPLNAAVTPKLKQRHRATYLSIQSLAGRLSFAGFLLALSVAAGASDQIEPEVLSKLAAISSVVGVIALIGLAVTSGAVSDPPDES